ncbi:putative Transposon TX1 [Gossypium australe]|uniref:Putative Transposon TX1 n=1 Tax=Gossypium australe TaxID=47621 RepID=A0A5B6UAG9_9ROSI|nr:putative Transposon TX1 [Gossypium australe]
MVEMKRLNLELRQAIKSKESVWRQKSRMTWLKDGNSNTTFFHRAVKIRVKRKIVHGMKIGNSWYCEPKELKEKMFNFFINHFSYPLRKWKMDMVLKFNRLNEAEALKLEVPFSMEEIKEAVWSCDKNKASGPDGFSQWFFRKCWKIVQKDLFKMMGEFYKTGKLEISINLSFIAPIP